MTLSRKEFLAQGVFSLGRMLLTPEQPCRHSEPSPVIRPPGFTSGRETECGECEICRSACPEGVIGRSKKIIGPVLEFSNGGCRFCNLCSEACPTGVLAVPVEGEITRLGVARFGTGCLARGGCFTCSERCPEGAIEVAWGSGIRIDPERCTGCGWCEASCPVRPKAIRVEPLFL